MASKIPPPLPPVQSDSALAIFQHSSVKSSAQNERFGDAERLAFIGIKVLHMVIAEIQFEKRPMLAAVELIVRAIYLSIYITFISSITSPQKESDDTLSDEVYEQWVSRYELREKVACSPEHRSELYGPMVRLEKLEVRDQSILTRGHRKHSIYSMPTWVLYT
jgi:hypothetical protein